MHRLLALLAAAAVATTAFADDMATPQEAKALSEKAQAAVNTMGKDKAYAAFANPAGEFQNKDPYVFRMDMNGVMLFHPKKSGLLGKNLIGFNKYGDELFKEMVEVAKKNGSGWVDYKWPYPGTDAIREKTTYIMTNNEGFFCGVGAYK